MTPTPREVALIQRIERAPDFGYDDEQVALNASLAQRGLAWKWAPGENGERITLITLAEFQEAS